MMIEKQIIAKMTLEQYKKLVENYFLNKLKLSKETTAKLMKNYEDDFPQFLNEQWDPEVAGCAMLHGY